MTLPPKVGQRIRRAGDRDCKALAEAHRSCFAASWDSDAMRTLLQTPGTAAWLATGPDDAAAGLILARAAGDEIEILTLGVDPALRRHGIARSLLDAACLWALAVGGRRMLLEVADDNAAARALYERTGFVLCGRRPDYYSGTPRRDALILERALV